MIGLTFLFRWWRERFTPEPPDIAEIEARYREHDQKIAQVQGTARQVKRWRLNIESHGRTGNIVRDIAAGTYRPHQEPESHP